MNEIVRLHGVLVSIIYDRGSQFTSRFWRSFQESLGTGVDLSTPFHPQTDGHFERTIQILEDMLRAFILDFGGWFEVGKANVLGLNLVQDKIQLIRQRLLTAQSIQKPYADKRRRDLVFTIGDKVILRVSPKKDVMRFGKRVFHVSMLRKYISDSYHVLEAPTIPIDENLTYEEEPVAMEKQVRRLRSKEIVSIKVLWRNHTTEEATCKLEKEMRDKYPLLFQSTSIHLF
ncbi:uncharacterized protein LOC107023583 [Solanum pennellii]|uniref:Uncharacterized protein LOC107023583 n=1 Tax=Solanum pennellii TaxID=28526 RepID=A0ABM1H3E6_SOLPN|nr:uncharacterized protein LOC107023583 [Solanum pennellii]